MKKTSDLIETTDSIDNWRSYSNQAQRPLKQAHVFGFVSLGIPVTKILIADVFCHSDAAIRSLTPCPFKYHIDPLAMGDDGVGYDANHVELSPLIALLKNYKRKQNAGYHLQVMFGRDVNNTTFYISDIPDSLWYMDSLVLSAPITFDIFLYDKQGVQYPLLRPRLITFIKKYTVLIAQGLDFRSSSCPVLQQEIRDIRAHCYKAHRTDKQRKDEKKRLTNLLIKWIELHPPTSKQTLARLVQDSLLKVDAFVFQFEVLNDSKLACAYMNYKRVYLNNLKRWNKCRFFAFERKFSHVCPQLGRTGALICSPMARPAFNKMLSEASVSNRQVRVCSCHSVHHPLAKSNESRINDAGMLMHFSSSTAEITIAADILMCPLFYRNPEFRSSFGSVASDFIDSILDDESSWFQKRVYPADGILRWRNFLEVIYFGTFNQDMFDGRIRPNLWWNRFQLKKFLVELGLIQTTD